MEYGPKRVLEKKSHERVQFVGGGFHLITRFSPGVESRLPPHWTDGQENKVRSQQTHRNLLRFLGECTKSAISRSQPI